MDKLSDGELLESIVVHMMKDTQKNEEALEGQKLPEKHFLTPVSSVQVIQKVVLRAKREKKIIRVAGSKHSLHAAIFGPKDGINLLLTKELRKVEIRGVKKEDGKQWLDCRIGAGCYLGKNPLDPSSDVENSACYQVNIHGFGFPELGGIIQQSVGGFMMTGSAGGSLQHSFSDVIQEIEFVDGNGEIQNATPGTALWAAVGVSMGLFGVITHVSFRLPEMALIEGTESNHKFAESALGPDDEGKSKLKENLEQNEYVRVNWFPQKHVKRVQQWVGKQTTTDNGDRIPYNPITSCCLVAGMAGFSLCIMNCLLEKTNPTQCDYCLIGAILRVFVPLFKPFSPKHFRDIWFETLPMDNQTHTDSIMKMEFTEIWMPLDQCQTVMDKLLALFENQQACNNLATEMYGAKETPFWLSMSYNQKMVRVDPYWWAYNKGDKRKFFSYFWDVLLDIPGTRLHWGKYLPLPGQKYGNTTFNLDYLKKVYPKMDDWLKMREKMDPDQVFVNDYWRDILEIPPPSR